MKGLFIHSGRARLRRRLQRLLHQPHQPRRQLRTRLQQQAGPFSRAAAGAAARGPGHRGSDQAADRQEQRPTAATAATSQSKSQTLIS